MSLTLFWIPAITLCAAIGGAIVLASKRAATDLADTPGSENDELAIYKGQLRDVERDAESGVLAAEEAERLRTEIARRILALDARSRSETGRAGPGWTVTLLGTAAAMALGGALYWQMGAYGYGDLPLTSRLQAAQDALGNRMSQLDAEAQLDRPAPQIDEDMQELLDQLRQAMVDHPERIDGWSLLARCEARIGDFSAAWRAQDAFITRQDGSASAQDYAILADMMVQAAGGYVSPQAQDALARALALDGSDAISRYYTGLMMAQIGRPDVALTYWDALLREGPESAPWVQSIRSRIDNLAWEAGQPNYIAPEPASGFAGPSAADIDAASELSNDERAAMIQGMVEGLAAELASDGGPPEKWARLITSLGVLGRKDEAQGILDEAKTVFAADADGLALLRQAADQAGLAF